ncbi:MAG TPA: AmmeMemoRadiSam system protein B [bacterium]|nr:AmmeMemoRadiSam system protein B [bacterium]
MNKRRPAVAGQFYPGSAREIEAQIARLVDEGAAREKVIGALAPHAGWMYSGRAAGLLYSRIEIPETVVVMCPNHRGLGADAAVMAEGSWELPTGEVQLDGALARAIMARCGFLRDDARAHQNEHSLEVQVPLLQHFRPDFKLTPISLSRVSLEECEELGRAIADAVEEQGRETLVVASSDMTHFESAPAAKKKDGLALERLTALDPAGLYNTVMKNRISMCGVIPATIMLYYALARGASMAEVIDYRNSGDVTGDYSDVVAYAAAIVK